MDTSDQSFAPVSPLRVAGVDYYLTTPVSDEVFKPVRRSAAFPNLVQLEMRNGYKYLGPSGAAGDIARDRMRTEIGVLERIESSVLWVSFACRTFGVGGISDEVGTIINQVIGQFDDEPLASAPCARIDLRRNSLLFRTAGGPGPYVSTPTQTIRYEGPPMVEGRWERFLYRLTFNTSAGTLDFWRGIENEAMEQVVSLTDIPLGFDWIQKPRIKRGCYGPMEGVPGLVGHFANFRYGEDLSWVLDRPIPLPNMT